MFLAESSTPSAFQCLHSADTHLGPKNIEFYKHSLKQACGGSNLRSWSPKHKDRYLLFEIGEKMVELRFKT